MVTNRPFLYVVISALVDVVVIVIVVAPTAATCVAQWSTMIGADKKSHGAKLVVTSPFSSMQKQPVLTDWVIWLGS